jgi:hypothetical protein
MILLSFQLAYGQKDEIDAKLKEYGIPGDYIVNALKDANAEYYFKFKSVTWMPSKQGMEEIVEEGEFDPGLPVGQRWRLLKVNGRQPYSKELKKFNKAQNTLKNNVNTEIDEENYRIEEDNDTEMIISLRYKDETLPQRYTFLSDCSGLAYVDKKKNRLTRIEYRNDYAVRVWNYKATGLSLVQYYTYNEAGNNYFISREEMDLEANYLGQGVSILFDIEYSDYRKVK